MKKRALSAFTLIEMLTVMAIIAVIASLVVAVNGLVSQKAAKARAEGEIQAITAAAESYKADNGIYPTHSDTSEAFEGQSAVTDNIDPRRDMNPLDRKYQLSSLYLYSQLSGDLTGPRGPDGKPDADSKVYFPFKPEMLGTEKNKSKEIEKVLYLQDPFGQSYGYSTAAASAEAEYQRELRRNPSTKRGSDPKGYNSATFDLWSTGGTANKSSTSGSTSGAELEQARWIKNW